MGVHDMKPKGFSGKSQYDSDWRYKMKSWISTSYLLEKDIKDTGSPLDETLYSVALRYEEHRVYHGENSLFALAEEIKIRSRIIKNELFHIGALLWLGKKQCHQENKSFKGWIGKNFEFSYETANNLMNVFRYCFALRNIAMSIPLTFLYKISSPSYPEELREYLLENERLAKIGPKYLRLLTDRYKREGLEAIEAEVDGLNSAVLTFQQTRKTFDLVTNCIRQVGELRDRILGRGQLKMIGEPFEYDEQIANEINEALLQGVERSLFILRRVDKRARGKLGDFSNKFHGDYDNNFRNDYHKDPSWDDVHIIDIPAKEA